MLIYALAYILGAAIWLVPPLLIARTSSERSSRRVIWTVAALLSPAIVFIGGVLPLQLLAVKYNFSAADIYLGWYSFVVWGFNIAAFLAPCFVLWLFHRRREK